MLKKKDTTIFCILIFVAVVYVGSAMKMQALRDGLDPAQTVSALQVRPEILEIVSGEFRHLLADYLLLKASIYLGGRHSATDSSKKTVSTLFRQALGLNPYLFQACYFVQGFLPWWRGGYVNEAIELLEISKKFRDWDWRPKFYIGFDYYYFLNDNLTASKYLMEAGEKHESARSLALLGARLSQRGGKTKAAIEFLEAMSAGTEREKAREDIRLRIEALKGLLIIEKGISQYSLAFRHPPESLEQLIEAGILKRLPINPFRRDGIYLYENGILDF